MLENKAELTFKKPYKNSLKTKKEIAKYTQNSLLIQDTSVKVWDLF